MEFARRGPATAAADDDVDDGRRFPDPAPQGDPMLVMRDALLLQLQKDRLRQEIIVSELAKIERAMALRTASGYQATPMTRHGMAAADVERAKPWSTFREEFIVPQRRGPVDREHYADVGEERDVKLPNKDGRQSSAESNSRKPFMEDQTDECLKPCCCNGKPAQQNAASDEKKPSESNETIPPKKTSPAVKWELTGITIPVKKPKSTSKWSCSVCQVQATSERNLQEHCAGQKHQSNVATLELRTKAIGQKAKTTAEPSPGAEQKTSSIKWSCSTCQVNGTSKSDLEEHFKGKRRQQNIEAPCKEGNVDGITGKVKPQDAKSHESNVNAPQRAEKLPSGWSCSICQAICTCESDLQNHLKGKRHQAKIQALCEEGKNMTRNSESQEAKLHPNNVPQHAEKTISTWSCSICQALCTCEPDLENHLKGNRHQLKVHALRKEVHEEKNNPPKLAKNEKPPSEWCCSLCQAKCNSESQFENHCRSMRHQQKMEALQGEGKNANASSLNTANELPSDDPNSNSASSDKVERQTALYLCQVCNVQCNSEKMLAYHCTGKKHAAKMEKPKALNFCEVCNLQCNSEKVLADHQSGKKHLENVAKQKTSYFCKVCNLQCSNKKMLADHRSGEKHRGKLNAKK